MSADLRLAFILSNSDVKNANIDFVRSANSEKQVKTQKSVVEDYVRLISDVNLVDESQLVSFPVSVDSLVLYIRYCATVKKVQVQTCKDYVSMINTENVLSGYKSLDQDEWGLVKKAFKNFSKVVIPTEKKRAPLMSDDFIKFVFSLLNSGEQWFFKCIIVMTLASTSRLCEIVKLRNKDISFVEDGKKLKLCLFGTKTEPLVIKYIECINAAIFCLSTDCIVHCVKRLVVDVILGQDNEQLVFAKFNGESVDFMKKFKKFMKREFLLKYIEFDVEIMGVNSFRRSSSSVLKRNNASTELLKTAGNWKSDAMLNYIDEELKDEHSRIIKMFLS